MKKKTYTTEEIIGLLHHPSKRKAFAEDWDDGEYIQYCPNEGVIDENGESVNACVFIVNDIWMLLDE